jgi:hypothetical protein
MPLTCSASIGIAERLPGWDLPALLTHADQAMYAAKRAGGSTWRIYEDTMGATQAATGRSSATAASQGQGEGQEWQPVPGRGQRADLRGRQDPDPRGSPLPAIVPHSRQGQGPGRLTR